MLFLVEDLPNLAKAEIRILKQLIELRFENVHSFLISEKLGTFFQMHLLFSLKKEVFKIQTVAEIQLPFQLPLKLRLNFLGFSFITGA